MKQSLAIISILMFSLLSLPVAAEPDDNIRKPGSVDNAVLSNFHRGNYSLPGEKTVTDLGAIKSMKTPWEGAQIKQDGGLRGRAISFYSSTKPGKDGQARISYVEHAHPLSLRSEPALNKLLASHEAKVTVLYADNFKPGGPAYLVEALKQLAPILGTTSVGDNQLTGGARTPAFHLTTVKIETVNGRAVLAIDGWFMPESSGDAPTDSNVKRFYSGIFVDSGNNRPPDELYVQADGSRSFKVGRTEFQSTLRTIKWR
jgi:hypothetical protein